MSQPLRIEVAGKMLHCKHCDGETFFRERAAFGRQFGRGAGGWSTVYICAECGYMHFFKISTDYGNHEQTETVLPSERIECLACGELFFPSESSSECQSCGWTWLSDVPAADDTIDESILRRSAAPYSIRARRAE